MALYRCAMCGSSKIVPETKQEGYNKKKGIWGAVLFGEIGALAGTSGNTVTYYHCGDCGQVLNRTMLPVEKESVERCLANPDIFESSLKRYKERYKNIEWEEKTVISISDNLPVSDIEELKELSLKESASEKAKKLLHTNDYASIIKEVLSTHDSMTWEEIYNYLKQNNHLTEDVVKAEKENKFIPLYFTKACIRKMRVADRIDKGTVDLVVFENDRYRLKNEKEVKDSNAILEEKTKEKILKQIDTLTPIIMTLQKAKKPIKVSELWNMCDDLKKYSNQTITARLNQLANTGILEKRIEKKTAYFSVANISQPEIDNILYKAISNNQIRGFLD